MPATAMFAPTASVTLTSYFDSVQSGYYLWAQCTGGDLATVFMTYGAVSATLVNTLN